MGLSTKALYRFPCNGSSSSQLACVLSFEPRPAAPQEWQITWEEKKTERGCKMILLAAQSMSELALPRESPDSIRHIVRWFDQLWHWGDSVILRSLHFVKSGAKFTGNAAFQLGLFSPCRLVGGSISRRLLSTKVPDTRLSRTVSPSQSC
jgi:hypothetical protein